MYCPGRGGRLRIVTRRDGERIGIRALPGGRRVEKWKLYRSWKGRPKGDLVFLTQVCLSNRRFATAMPSTSIAAA